MSIVAVGNATTTLPSTVDPTRTPVSQTELRAAIDRAYRRVMGKAPSSALLDNLTAQASVETGRGAQMYNYNFGGIKGSSPTGQTAQCLTHEVVGGKEIAVKQGFRAYASIDQGAEDYVRVLKKSFGVALGKAELADVGGFAHALKQAGYYTASESDYANALRSQTGAATPAAAPAAAKPDLDTFFDSLSLARIQTALSESALRIASPAQDTSSGT
jgi:hypothetical protein